MTESQAIWKIVWARAARGPNAREPFEIDEVVPDVVEALGVSEEAAKRKVAGLLKELERLPEGEQYFAMEGNAVEPLEEFAAAPKDAETALRLYPFEI